jgi:prepilin-type N-terminal cleavage/methylation domain-containing protein
MTAAGRGRHQRGFTLVEMLVTSAVLGVAMVLVVGMISVAVKGGVQEKQLVLLQVAVQYEVDKVSATAPTAGYTDCFLIGDQAGSGPAPAPAVTAGTPSCPAGDNVQAVVSGPSTTTQLSPLPCWTVTVTYVPTGKSPPGPTSVCHR